MEGKGITFHQIKMWIYFLLAPSPSHLELLQLPYISGDFDSSLTAPTLLHCFLPQVYTIRTYQAINRK